MRRAHARFVWLGLVSTFLWAAPAAAQSEGLDAPSESPPPDATESEAEPAPPPTEQARAEPPDEPPPPDELADVEPAAGEDDFTEVRRFLGIESRRETWELDDGVDEDSVEWDDYDADRSYTPRGMLHFGIGARVAAMPGGGANFLPAPDGPLIGLSFIADIRYSPTMPWRMRLELMVNYQPYGEQFVGAGTTIAQSPFAARLRILPLSVDIGRLVGVRGGLEIGTQWAPGVGSEGGQLALLAGSSIDVVLMLLDGLLEVGITGGVQFTAVGRSGRDPFNTDLRPEGMIGATGALFFE